MHLWERANGKSIRLLKLVPPVESFAETFEFENEIETSEPLLFMLRRFLEQLSRRLGALYLVAKELTLKITFSDKKHYEHRFQNSGTDQQRRNAFPDAADASGEFHIGISDRRRFTRGGSDQTIRRNNSVCLKQRCVIRRSFPKRLRA